MRNTIFIASALSMLLLSCGKSQESTEVAKTGSDVEDVPATVVSELQDTGRAAQAEVTGAAEEPAAAVEAVETVKADNGTEGEAVYKQACISCHMTGAAGAPKVGDTAAWNPRIAKGADALVQSAIDGVPGTAMIARGACNTCSDDDIRTAVEYMISQSR